MGNLNLWCSLWINNATSSQVRVISKIKLAIAIEWQVSVTLAFAIPTFIQGNTGNIFGDCDWDAIHSRNGFSEAESKAREGKMWSLGLPRLEGLRASPMPNLKWGHKNGKKRQKSSFLNAFCDHFQKRETNSKTIFGKIFPCSFLKWC